MLDAYSTSHWYSLVDPTNQGLRSFVYRYSAGYEPNRPMMQYHDHRKRGICFAVDFVAGFAVTRHRGIVRNNVILAAAQNWGVFILLLFKANK